MAWSDILIKIIKKVFNTLLTHCQVLHFPPKVELGILNLSVGSESRHKESPFVGAGDKLVGEADSATGGNDIFIGDVVVPIGDQDEAKMVLGRSY